LIPNTITQADYTFAAATAAAIGTIGMFVVAGGAAVVIATTGECPTCAVASLHG